MGLLKTAAKVGVASAVHGRVQRRQQQRWARQDAQAAAADAQALATVAPAPAASQPGTATQMAPVNDAAAQLELLAKLGELRQAGVLTEAEFEAKKAEILAAGS